MEKLNAPKHWTAESTENFTYRIASDFLAQVEARLEKDGTSRSELAQRLSRTLGRVSQLFNPGNITVSSAVRLGQATGMKVALVAYDDDDPQNQNGPINSDIFYRCWKYMGSPKTFFELARSVAPVGYYGHSQEAATLEIAEFLPDLHIYRSAQTHSVIH
jgi:hypothetical protein